MTPYQKKANANYRERHDFITLTLPKGTKKRLREVGKGNADLARAVMKWLDKLEDKAHAE